MLRSLEAEISSDLDELEEMLSRASFQDETKIWQK